MRVALWTIIALGMVGSLAMGSSAFNWASVPRTVTIAISDEALAYLSIGANGASPHRCFVDKTDGKIALLFDTPSTGCGAGTGTGINPGDGATSGKYSRYAFHDILLVTNKARTTLTVWVNATTGLPNERNIDVALESASGQMTDAKYSNAETLTGLTVGTQAYLGVRVKSGTVSSGSITTTISVEARR